jgi:hypothetical protein
LRDAEQKIGLNTVNEEKRKFLRLGKKKPPCKELIKCTQETTALKEYAKSKALPVQAQMGPEICRRLRLPGLLTIGT